MEHFKAYLQELKLKPSTIEDSESCKRWRQGISICMREQFTFLPPPKVIAENCLYHKSKLYPCITTWLQVRSFFNPKGDELIAGSTRNIMNQLIAELQRINPAVTNALHIRGSVILNWLKSYSKREVQYKAGHKYISSTEKYASQEMEGLQDELSKHHPFG